MTSDGATLSSTATALDDLTQRVTEIAGRYVGTDREEIAHTLFEVERSLTAASRRLEKVVDQLT